MAAIRGPVTAHVRYVHHAVGAIACPASRTAAGSCKVQQLRPSNPLISRLHTAVVRRQGTSSRSAVRVQANGSGLKIDLTGELIY